MESASPDTDLDLDGSTGVVLAPIRGRDIRRGLDSDLFAKRPARFTGKFAIAVAVIAVCWALVAVVQTWWMVVIAVPVLGLLYAHLVELQHECLHEHAYNSRAVNRLVGFLCGVPMFSSYWHYKYEHLRHHAFLGTPNNQEFFNYRFNGINSVGGFLRSSFHLGRYVDVFKDMGRGLIGRYNPRVIKPIAGRRIRQEYIAFAILLIAAIAVSVLTRSWYLVFVWVIPTLLVAEPAHFLVELPEHFGLNTQTDPDVLSNTRTVHGSRFAKWFTNGNDLHTAHHFHQGVPMAHVPELHELIANQVRALEPSYWSFYRKVMNGELRFQGEDETCMTR